MSIICPECGKENVENVSSCAFCGFPFSMMENIDSRNQESMSTRGLLKDISGILLRKDENEQIKSNTIRTIPFKCEICNSSDIVKQQGFFTCLNCGCRYTVEEVKKAMLINCNEGKDNEQSEKTTNKIPNIIDNNKDNDLTLHNNTVIGEDRSEDRGLVGDAEKSIKDKHKKPPFVPIMVVIIVAIIILGVTVLMTVFNNIILHKIKDSYAENIDDISNEIVDCFSGNDTTYVEVEYYIDALGFFDNTLDISVTVNAKASDDFERLLPSEAFRKMNNYRLNSIRVFDGVKEENDLLEELERRPRMKECIAFSITFKGSSGSEYLLTDTTFTYTSSSGISSNYSYDENGSLYQLQ